jgi:hypothetical protein
MCKINDASFLYKILTLKLGKRKCYVLLDIRVISVCTVWILVGIATCRLGKLVLPSDLLNDCHTNLSLFWFRMKMEATPSVVGAEKGVILFAVTVVRKYSA